MHLLRSLLLLTLAACLHAAEPAPAYDVVEGIGVHRVLSADAVDGYRVTTPDGRTIGIPAADPADALTSEALTAALTTPPPPPPVPVPSEVGAGQIRAAMIASGYAADGDALDALITAKLALAIADPTQRAIATTLWRHATTFKRDHTFIAGVAAALGKTSAEIDDLFRLAATF